MTDYSTMVVATDLSDPSLAAVRQAAALAGRLGSRLVLLYVMEPRLPPVILARSSESEEQLMQRHEAQAAETLEKMAASELAGCEVDIVVRRGSVHDKIVELARQRGADLIVVGMHGHGFLSHALTGSTAERVLHHAPCPVLVVGHSHVP